MQNFIDNHSNSTLKDHNSLGLSSSGELIIDYYQDAFDPGLEVLDENKPLQNNIFTNKIGKDIFSQDFINNHYNSTFKYKNSFCPSFFSTENI